MKNLVLFLGIVFSTINLNVQAQSFSLTAPGNIPVNNGDTITIVATTATYPFGIVSINNNASVTKPVMVMRQELSMVPGTESAFAFGWNMYPPTVSLSPSSFDILPGVTDSSFQGWYFHNGLPGTSYVQYAFFDEFNPSDSAWVVFKYGITQATALAEGENLPGIQISPNPATNEITISTPLSTYSIFVYDITGKLKVVHQSESGTKEIDISNLKSGIYTICILNEKREKVLYSKFVKE